MRIDTKLMNVDQSKFEILALQISEDDSLCRPECVPLIYNVSTSSIHGNIFITLPNYDSNIRTSSLQFIENKNELEMN